MDGLIREMETEPLDPISHFPTILVSVLNQLIVRHNLNSRRQYMSRRVNPLMANAFTRDVYNSLINGAPVILAFDGGYTPLEPGRRHFIIIYGVRITEEFATFFAMDPPEWIQLSETNLHRPGVEKSNTR